LIFKDPRHFLSVENEKERYLLHENHFENLGYQEFLLPVVQWVQMTLPTSSHGLDYGCGPGPVLAKMLTTAGFQMTLYDPFFANNPLALEQKYDFVTCTEAAEHFFSPEQEFQKLAQLLKEKTDSVFLFIMTSLHQGPEAFASWHYRQDPTHVCFYSQKTFHFIAEKWGWEVEFHSTTKALLKFSRSR
jgi:SAM-dependent methyltransferase